MFDPATIVLENQLLFVQDSQNTNTFTSVVETELTQIIGGGGSGVQLVG
jgi:hypothetical protein